MPKTLCDLIAFFIKKKTLATLNSFLCARQERIPLTHMIIASCFDTSRF